MSDLISRTELFNELSRVPISQYAVDERTMIYNKINEMPTAETTGDLDDAIQEYIKSGLMEFDDFRPKGHWIGEGDGYADGCIVYDTWYCSECDHCEEGEELALPNFCPDCGADMRGEDNE